MAAYYDRTYFENSDTYQDYFGYAEAVTQLGYCPRLHRLAPFIHTWRSQRVLEIGCAAGSTLALIQRQGGLAEGIEISKTAAGIARDCFELPVFNGPFEEAVLAPNTYDCVLMFDVLEHIPNDQPALNESYRLLKSDGLILVTVPACKFLWSEHDLALEHYRRYSYKELGSQLKKAGFKIIRESFAVSTVFPLILAYRIIRRGLNFFKKPAPKSSYVILPHQINAIFIKILKTEGSWLRKHNLPIGTSLIALAQKNEK